MNRIRLILQDRGFLRKTFTITIPIVLQNLLNNVLNLVDTLMIGRLGETSIAAVGLANKVFFVFVLLMFGICSGSGVLASQFWGKRDMFSIKRVLYISLLIGVAGSFIFTIPGIFFPKYVMRIFTPQKATIAQGAIYLSIIAFSYPLTAITNVYVAILRSMNYVMLPVIITSMSIVVNVVFNYGMIFGRLGFPEMGVAGAALATVIARVVEVTSLLLIIYLHKAGDGRIGDFIHQKIVRSKEKGTALFDKAFLIKYFRTASPVIANEFIWGLGVTMYSLVYGRMGDAAVASITISNTVEQVAMVFFFGMCSAAAVILGNELGANELEKAEEHAKNYIVLQIMLTLVGAVVLILLREELVAIFAVSDNVSSLTSMCILVFTLYMPIRMQNALFIVAIFRSGGDTKAALVLDATSVWLIGLPMAILGGLILRLPIYIVYAMVLLEEVYKFALAVWRYRKKKWLRNIVS